MLLAFKLQLSVRENISKSIDNSLRQDKYLKDREYLFTRFKKELTDKDIEIDTEVVKNFLNESERELNINYQGSSLTFDKNKQLIKTIYSYDDYHNRIEYFDFSAENEKLLFFIMDSEIKSK